jgi:hypothetical protein
MAGLPSDQPKKLAVLSALTRAILLLLLAGLLPAALLAAALLPRLVALLLLARLLIRILVRVLILTHSVFLQHFWPVTRRGASRLSGQKNNAQ